MAETDTKGNAPLELLPTFLSLLMAGAPSERRDARRVKLTRRLSHRLCSARSERRVTF